MDAPRRAPDPAVAALAAMRVGWEVWCLLALLMFELVVFRIGGEEYAYIANIVGPCVLMAILLGAVAQIARRSAVAVWAPLFWFRVASAAYLGFGSLVPNIVNEETLSNIYAVEYFDQLLHLKINLIYTLGVFTTLAASRFLMSPAIFPLRRMRVAHAANFDTLRFAVLFLIIGGGLRYGVAIPVAFGLYGVVPGMLLTLANSYYVGIFLLIYHSVRNGGKYNLIIILLAFTDLFVSLVSFSKKEVLFILIFSFLGYTSKEFTRKKVIVGVTFMITIFISLQNVVHYGRDELSFQNGRFSIGGLRQRVEILQDYFSGVPGRVYRAEDQAGFSRLSYVNADAFVVNRYDIGLPGDSYGNALAVFIPRVLWPDKPSIVSIGSDLYYLITGFSSASFGVVMYSEGYWNSGWIGVLVIAFSLAVVLSIFSRTSARFMARRDWLFLPVVFMGIDVGVRIDGYFVPDVLGKGWMALVLGVALYVGRAAFMRLGSRPSAGSTGRTGNYA